MDTEKPTIHLNDDNWSDYFSWEYPDELVNGLAIGEDGVDLESGVVGLLREWVSQKSQASPNKRYELSKHDAAVILNLSAGWPDIMADNADAAPPAR